MSTSTNILGYALAGIALIGIGLLPGCDISDPGNPDEQPLYRKPGQESEPTSGERGKMMITEINYAGSVTNDGEYDGKDVFIELQNKSERPTNISGWRLDVDGGTSETYTLPTIEEPLQPNEYFVIASQEDGAFGEVADLILEDLRFGKKYIEVELRDADQRLMTSIGSSEIQTFAGGYDTVTARSMERVSLIFANSGSRQRNWHAYSSQTGLNTIAEGYRERTLASPGEANSPDYSGSTSSGSFE
jgi:hypothetical protein